MIDFQLHRSFCSAFTVSQIEKAISWTQSTIKLYGKEVLQPRLTSWMGTEAYTYSGRRHEPNEIPLIVAALKLGVEDKCGQQFNSVLGNLYRDGSDSVSWHADDEKELGPQPIIASLSFGASRTFAIRHNETRERWDIELRHGDLLIMSGRSQLDYQHSVPKTKKKIGSRINLTFRNIY